MKTATDYSEATTTATGAQAHDAIIYATDRLLARVNSYEAGVTKGTNKAQLRREAERLLGMYDMARALFPAAWNYNNPVETKNYYNARCALYDRITHAIAAANAL